MKKIQVWVKSNQTLAISALVSLLLVAGAVYYLMHGMSVNASMAEELTSAKTRLESLQSATPYPNAANIEAMKAEALRVEALRKDFDKRFAPVPVPEDTYTASGFKYELETMVAELNQKAKNLSIQLPTNRVNFSYSFTAQRSNLRMDTNSLRIQAEQLAHVKYLCNTLMDSGISEFIRVRRAAGATNDLLQVANNMADYLPARKIITNQFSFSYPYELVFNTSPGDLAKFVNDLQQSPYGLMIKCIKVERAASELSDELAGYQETINPMMGRYNPRMMGGGRMDPRMMTQGRPVEQAKTAAEEEAEKALPKVTTTVLKPTALRVTLYVDFVRLKTEEEAEETKATAAAAVEGAETIDIDGDNIPDIYSDGKPLPGVTLDEYGMPVRNGAGAGQTDAGAEE
ncbi:MAG: Amuc_1100 family pilus-like protein [Verrucomicrobia bacterium]|nr:Amuc_1100 family pilus-like protein [Verrucomicrobiota bacterium]